MAGWLTAPIELHSMRMFDCEGFTPEQCEYYTHRWRFWYIADHVYGLSTIAFFMCAIGIFIIGHVVSSHILGYSKYRGPPIWRKLVAAIRYLTYRGFHVKALGWNTAPIGLLLLAAVGTIFFFCMDLIPQPYYWSSLDFGGSPPLATRSGWMALACMPFIFATASKTNWITLLTGISHEKLQVIHRWTSYAFFVLALLHTFPFIVYHVRFHDMQEQFRTGLVFYWTGIVALIVQAWLTFASFSSIRNLGYEFFKIAHFTAAVVFVLIFFWHCDYTLSSWDYFIATAAVYVPCFVYPWLRTCFEYGVGQKAQIFLEENGFLRITIPANFDWAPGQHCFLRFRGFGLQTISSHPFTICSTPTGPSSELVFYVRHQGGLTARMYHAALKQPGLMVPVLVDGPYGGIDLQKYYKTDHLLVVAGGSGAGWALPLIERFVHLGSLPASSSSSGSEKQQHQQHHHDSDTQSDLKATVSQDNTPLARPEISGPRSLRMILATRDISTRTWFLRTVGEILAKYPNSRFLSQLQVEVYLTGDAEQLINSSNNQLQAQKPEVGVHAKSVNNSSSSGASTVSSTDKTRHRGGAGGKLEEDTTTAVPEEDFQGRPQLPVIIRGCTAQAGKVGESLSVFVCGPTTMQNDVRNAVAEANLNILKGSQSGGVYLHSEHFSWA